MVNSTSSLSGRTYIVSGGGSGIGLETVRLLVDASAIVHAIDLKATAPVDFDQWQGAVHYHGSIDVSSREDVVRVFKAITSTSAQIDGLVNCAGICPGGEGYFESDSTFAHTMAVNVTGTWNVTTEFLKILHRQSPNNGPDGTAPTVSRISIVTVGSSASLCPWPTLTSYTTSKHAVLGLTRSWALDWSHKGVRVNMVAPGGTDTPLARAQLTDSAGRGDALSAGLKFIPLGRLGYAREQADAIIFLLSDASSYITGQVIPVNGGIPMH